MMWRKAWEERGVYMGKNVSDMCMKTQWVAPYTILWVGGFGTPGWMIISLHQGCKIVQSAEHRG